MNKKITLKWTFYLFSIGLFFSTLSVQGAEEFDLESLYDKTIGEDSGEQQRRSLRQKDVVTNQDRREFKKVSELELLSTFKNIAVISKKFSPRTRRAELSVQGVFFGNNNYAHSLGLSGHIGWYFTEKIGMEFSAFYLGKVNRPIANSLREINIVPSVLIPKIFYGAYFKWSFLYGKMSYFKKDILYFDMPLKFGFGLTNAAEEALDTSLNSIRQTDINGINTFSFGVSPTWALNKNFSVRVEALANYYKDIGFRGPESLLISAGLSWFFPEVSYR